MTHVHDHHGGGTTVIEDREGPAVALIVLIVLAVLALLIWFVGFSGVVIDRDTGPSSPTRIEDNSKDTTNNNFEVPSNSDPAPAPQGT